MNFIKKQEHNKAKKKISVVILTLIIICGVVFTIYVNSFYHAQENAINDINETTEIEVREIRKNTLVFRQRSTDNQTNFNENNGLIFYPGGKVDYRAYAPLMKALAKKGITCVLIKMPYNLAVFDIDAAKGIKDYIPEVKNWYIAGHSLGGAMACKYAAENEDELKGVILLGAYSANDLKITKLKCLSIYGTNDNVLNRDKYKENLKNLPSGYKQSIIQGGCHSFFGKYGMQKNDGEPTISNDQQIEETAEYIADFVM